VIAEGRASEILDLGDGSVLRRFKERGDPEREATVMALARGHGYPVPEVREVRGDGLVLERVDGPTMMADCRRRPWRLPDTHGRSFACTTSCIESLLQAASFSTSTCTRRTCCSPLAARW
jgi:hypothetical protein